MFNHPGRVITKFQFSSLFRQAWSKGMSDDNICAGWKQNQQMRNAQTAPRLSWVTSQSRFHLCVIGFLLSSSQNLERYENNYDIYSDHDYVAWLQEFYPESVPAIEMMLGLGSFDISLPTAAPMVSGSPTSDSHPKTPVSGWVCVINLVAVHIDSSSMNSLMHFCLPFV